MEDSLYGSQLGGDAGLRHDNDLAYAPRHDAFGLPPSYENAAYLPPAQPDYGRHFGAAPFHDWGAAPAYAEPPRTGPSLHAAATWSAPGSGVCDVPINAATHRPQFGSMYATEMTTGAAPFSMMGPSAASELGQPPSQPPDFVDSVFSAVLQSMHKSS